MLRILKDRNMVNIIQLPQQLNETWQSEEPWYFCANGVCHRVIKAGVYCILPYLQGSILVQVARFTYSFQLELIKYFSLGEQTIGIVIKNFTVVVSNEYKWNESTQVLQISSS